MQKAKQAVADFVSHDGKHKTTVHEDANRAITEEQVRPHQHENITTAVDKEVHQDHHHTTIQPVKAKEVLPEQHSHNVVPVEHKTFDHGKDSDIRGTLDREAAKFKDSSVTHGTTHSATAAPVVSGERTHHHVHEHVQPVIQKETIAPNVVHTTVPVHETHHAAAVHHGTSVLPAESLESFNKGGHGTLEGRGVTKVAEFDGQPKPYNDKLQLDGHNNHSGTTGTTGRNELPGGRNNLPGSQHNDHTHAQNGGVGTGLGANGSDRVTRNSAANAGTAGTQGTKPSLVDKLNPMKDADGDGQKGFMK